MSLSLGNIETPIEDRIRASLALGSFKDVIVAPAPEGSMPVGTDKPLVVYQCSLQRDTNVPFRSDIEVVAVEVAVIGLRSKGNVEPTGILNRIYGNADPGTADPTRGLHRHKLTGFTFDSGLGTSTGSATHALRVSESTAHTEEHLVYVTTYEFRLERV